LFDYLIVGAGFAGSVLAERISSQLNKKVLLVDKRNHIGGNAYDYYNEEGILVHKYGPHIFHTNSQKVVDYLSQFTEWRPYFHRVLAFVEGEKVPVPFNLNSIYELFPQNFAQKLEDELIANFGYGQKIPILKLRETANKNLKWLADYIYDNVFYGYTTKQWDLKPEELDASVTSRVPVFISRDNRYFQDTFQQIPKDGYTNMFGNILSHTNIKVLLQTDYKEIINQIKFKKLIFTGPIDEYFDFVHGDLPYRSLEFVFKTIDIPLYQKTAQLNFPNNNTYTRITEFKHISGQVSQNTTIAFEYPKSFLNKTEQLPYYPIPREENDLTFKKYLKEAEKLSAVTFCGRLADYKYYNMDQVVARALSLFEKGL